MVRLLLLTLAIVALLAVPGTRAGADQAREVVGKNETTAAYPFEVRLRKMHLVRPDLIPYTALQEYFA